MGMLTITKYKVKNITDLECPSDIDVQTGGNSNVGLQIIDDLRRSDADNVQC